MNMLNVSCRKLAKNKLFFGIKYSIVKPTDINKTHVSGLKDRGVSKTMCNKVSSATSCVRAENHRKKPIKQLLFLVLLIRLVTTF